MSGKSIAESSVSDDDVEQETDDENSSVWAAIADTAWPRIMIEPPKAFPETATSLSIDKTKRRSYEDQVLPLQIEHGSFVHVRSYLAFVLKMNDEYQFKQAAEELLWENAPTVSVAAQLGRILSVEFQSASSDGFVQVVHKVPTLPQKDPTPADIVIFVGNLEHPGHLSRNSHIAVALTFKPFGAEQMDEFLAEAACYGTDHMSVSGRSMVVVQVCWTGMGQMTSRAFGIVPWHRGCDEIRTKAQHRLTLLCEGQGREGLRMLVSGLKGYLSEFRKEKENAWSEQWLGPSAAVHYRYDGSGKAHVYKAYDHRYERQLSKASGRRRKHLPDPNVSLMRTYVDNQARMYKPCKHLRILKTRFWRKTIDASSGEALHAKRLAAILRQLQSLHRTGYVHGDIRVQNLSLDRGCFADLDMARKVHSGTVGDRQKRHELESMSFVLCLFQPVDEARQEEWLAKLTAQQEANDLFALIDYFESFPGQVKLRAEGESVDCLMSSSREPANAPSPSAPCQKDSARSARGKTLVQGLILDGDLNDKSAMPPKVQILSLGETKDSSSRSIAVIQHSSPYQIIRYVFLMILLVLAGMLATTHIQVRVRGRGPQSLQAKYTQPSMTGQSDGRAGRLPLASMDHAEELTVPASRFKLLDFETDNESHCRSRADDTFCTRE